MDYDPEKKGHVNIMINENERHEYMGESYSWFEQVIKNINDGSYCNVSRDEQNRWTREEFWLH